MKKRKHFIMTRFNLGLYRAFAKKPGAADEWMKSRLDIFSQYTVPSIASQTCDNYKWIILLDSLTNSKHLKRIKSEVSKLPHILVVCDWSDKRFKEGDSLPDGFGREFPGIIGSDCQQAIMTRLDNDDALASCFVEKVQSKINEIGNGDYVVDFADGCMYDTRSKECFLARHKPGTPFITLVESVRKRMLTVYGVDHYRMSSATPTYHSHSDNPMWMMVIHVRNKTNTMFEHLKTRDVTFQYVRGTFGL